MNEEIITGDSVQLKSGGPIMTVVSVAGDSVKAIWVSNGSAKYGQVELHRDCFKRADEQPDERN